MPEHIMLSILKSLIVIKAVFKLCLARGTQHVALFLRTYQLFLYTHTCHITASPAARIVLMSLCSPQLHAL
jgi:hypothetical protein